MFECEIVTPEMSLYKAPATFVALPAAAGEMGVMDMHVPYVTTLGSGKVRVTLESGDVEQFALAGGYAQVQSDHKVIVLANHAVSVGDVDKGCAEARVSELTEQIDALDSDSPERPYLVSELEWEKMLLEL